MSLSLRSNEYLVSPGLDILIFLPASYSLTVPTTVSIFILESGPGPVCLVVDSVWDFSWGWVLWAPAFAPVRMQTAIAAPAMRFIVFSSRRWAPKWGLTRLVSRSVPSEGRDALREANCPPPARLSGGAHR